MPSDARKNVLSQLAAVNDRVLAAINQDDADSMERLLVRHREVMARLARQGAVEDPAMAATLASLKAQVDQVTLAIKDKLAETGTRLAGNVNRRKLARAYGRRAQRG